MHTPKRIQFILPIAGIAGGVKVVYEYANRLQVKGHQVKVIYPGKLMPDIHQVRWKIEAPLRKLKYTLDHWQGRSEADWFPLQVPLIRIPSLEAKYIPDADITIATSNETSEWVAQLPARCGEKFYFIQAHEVWSRPESELFATYQLPLRKIVIASYLQELVETVSPNSVEGVVVNGIDTALFFPPDPDLRPNNPLRVFMLSHTWESKGITDGFAAVKLAREKVPNLQLVMFGVGNPRPDMPKGTEYHQQPSPEKLRQLYQTSDVFLCPSREEGGPLPPMEAMACRTAVVTTHVGAVPDYTIPGTTALVVLPNQPEDLGKALSKLLQNADLRSKIAHAGERHIQQFRWTDAANRFEKLLLGATK